MSCKRKPRPDLDEQFNLPDDTDPDDVLRHLLGVEDESVSDDSDEDDPDEDNPES